MLFVAKNGPNGRPDLDLMLISDSTDARQLFDQSFFRYDGHCSYSPDRRWILYDSYPDPRTPDMMRALQVYSLDCGKGVTLGRFRSEPCAGATTDLRCDLHPRWMPDGMSVSFDSIHEGFRGVYWADADGIMTGKPWRR